MDGSSRVPSGIAKKATSTAGHVGGQGGPVGVCERIEAAFAVAEEEDHVLAGRLLVKAAEDISQAVLQVGGAGGVFLLRQVFDRVVDLVVFDGLEAVRQAAGGVRGVDRPDVEPVVGPGGLGQLGEDEPGVLERPAGLAGGRVDDDGHVARPGRGRRQRRLQLQGEMFIARERLVGDDRLLREPAADVVGGGRDVRACGWRRQVHWGLVAGSRPNRPRRVSR